MKKIIGHIALLLLLGSIFSSCEKEKETIQEPASLTIVNGIAGATPLVTNFYNDKKLDYYRTAPQITAYGFLKYSGYVGDYNLGIYLFSDTTKTKYQTDIKLESNSIKTLYLTGTVAGTEGILITEKMPTYKQIDSVVSIRFVNLSKGSGPVNVVIRTPAKTVATNLDYKGISDFHTLSAKKLDLQANYIFDFKDATTGVIISSYTLSANATATATLFTTLLSKNITVALRGIRGGTGTSAPGTFLINNY